MDCEDAELVMAARDARTLTSREEVTFLDHLATCERCRQAASAQSEDEWRWLVRVPQDGFADADGLLLPTVDPGVFEIERELAAGGMGRILQARDRRLGRMVAIKEVLDRDLHARFEREALITARLQHPAIVPIYEAGTWPDGSGFYTMRLVPGGTLQAAIETTPTVAGRLALLHHVVAMTEAVAYAHAQRIIHRDLKPSNVLVGELGETVVIDWGLAKELDLAEPVAEPVATTRTSWPSSAELTRVGSVMGTPGFMAPEQARGEPLDERADVYALGAILYALLAGVPPYAEVMAAGTPDQLVEVGALRPPRSIDELAPDAPADLRAIVRRAMAWRAEDRYPTAREMAEQLRRFEAGQLLARQYGVRELIGRWIRRHRAAVAVGTIALLVVLAIAALAVINIGRSRAAERDARHTAERARDATEASFAALLEEQGRGAVLAGELDRALVYLSEALRRGRDTPALRHLLTAATRDRDLRRAELGPIAEYVHDLAFTAEGHVATFDDDGQLAIWNDQAAIRTHALGGKLVTAAFGPGATSLVVVGEDAALAMWDVATGQRRWRHEAFALEDSPPILRFDPTGTRLAYTTTGSNHVLVYELATGTQVGKLAIASGGVVDVAFGPDGKLVAASASDGGMWAWDTTTFAVRSAWRAPAAPKHLVFADAGRVVTTEGNRATVWSIADGKPAMHFRAHELGITAVAVDERSQRIVTADAGGSLRSWTFAGRAIGTGHQRGVRSLRFAPDGNVLVGGGAAGVYAWDPTTLEQLRAFDLGDEKLTGLAWSADGASFALSSTGDHVQVWARPRGALRGRFVAEQSIVAGELWLANGRDAAVVRRLDTGLEVARFAALPVRPANIFGESPVLQASRDGRRVLAATATSATLVELPSGRRIVELAAEDARLSANGLRVVQHDLPLDGDERVRVTDATTGALVVERTFADVDSPLFVAPSPDGATIALAFSNRPASLLRADTLEPRIAALASTRGAGHAEFDPTGRRVVAYGGTENTVTVHDAATGAMLTTLSTRATAVLARFDASGDLLALQTDKRTVELYALPSPQPRARIEHTSNGAFALSPDGTRLATGTSEGLLQLWDTATGRLLEVLRGHRLAITSLAFGPDGTFLLAQGNDRTATVWELPLDRRPAAEIARLADAVGWRLVDGELVPRR